MDPLYALQTFKSIQDNLEYMTPRMARNNKHDETAKAQDEIVFQHERQKTTYLGHRVH